MQTYLDPEEDGSQQNPSQERPGSHDANEDHGPDQLQGKHHEPYHQVMENRIQDSHVAAEAVEDPAKRRPVEELHWGP